MIYPENYYFTAQHEWINMEGKYAYIGLTELAIKELGAIQSIEIHTVGKSFKKDQVLGRVRSFKYLCKLIMPFNGKIEKINSEYCDKPVNMNESNLRNHWIVQVELDSLPDKSNLLSFDQYISYKSTNAFHMVKYLNSLKDENKS